MSRYRDDYGDDCKVYVGDLPKDVSEKELERVFREFGSIRSVWVARNPPGFAFVMFEDERDADDAVRTLDGSVICGVRARVKHSNARPTRSRPVIRKPFDPGDRCFRCNRRGHYAYDCEKYTGGAPRRSYSRSRSRSPVKRRSYSRERSYSRSRSASRGRNNRSSSRSLSRTRKTRRSPSRSESRSK